jgi:D-cysteine desulfhydrase family pyridoxal phosphate-dependent enzyme
MKDRTGNHTSETRQLCAAFSARPRVSLGQFPTHVEEAPRLSERLGVRVLVKRDDQTGLALGGNKVRKLEFLLGDALQAGCDCVVTTGGSQSNHARLTAAACRKQRLDCYLVLDRGVHPEEQGNILLDHLLGANVTLIESADLAVATREMEELARRLRDEGRRPYVIPRGGSVPVGATGYTAFVAETLEQLQAARIGVTHLYLGTGSCGTHSGVLAGLAAAGTPIKVQGIGVSRTSVEQNARIHDLSNATLRHLGLQATVDVGDIHVDDRFVGPGYGVPIPQTMEAIAVAARDEAMILDPVYTGKAMSGLIAHARERRFAPDDTVLFLHTGGSPALFAYNVEVGAAIPAAPL